MTAKNVTYNVAAGETIHGGKTSGGVVNSGYTFDSVVSITGTAAPDTSNQVLVLNVHGSSGQNYTTGRRYEAACSGHLAYSEHTKFLFSTLNGSQANTYIIRPVDAYNTADGKKRESMWLGFWNMPDNVVRLITEHRLDAMMEWAKTNVPHLADKRCVTGGSMGGWGSVTYGLRRPHLFAAVYPDRPRWSHSNVGKVAVADYVRAGVYDSTFAASPMLSDEDGGGKYSDYVNMIAYISDTSKKMPWVGWCIGRNDGFATFEDQIAAVNALRSAKRGFAFAWNDGNHSTGSIMSEILQSYPYGTFSTNKGYPLFTEHSGDQDPNVDLVGGINIGLSFRNVVETSSGWSCEVTSILGARTVKVEPISSIFKAAVAPKLVTIPAANTWVQVAFTI